MRFNLGKCYIAGKITDLTEQQWTTNFETAKKEVIALGYDPVSPVELKHEHNKTWNEFMREDLIAMLNCTAVYACDNYRESKGASIEVELADRLGFQILYQELNEARIVNSKNQ